MNISINPEEAIKYGNQIKEIAGSYNSEITKIYETIDTLKSAWTGTAAQRFTNDIESFETQFKDFGELITNFGELLVAIGQDYQKLEDNL